MTPIGPGSRCCSICGRWGTRGFREAESAEGGFGDVVCTNDRACRTRADRHGYPWPWKD